MRARHLLLIIGAVFMFLVGCGDDGGSAQDTAERVGDTVQEGAESLADAAQSGWVSFRTDFERLVDEAATGDNAAQEQLLEDCRDVLEDLRRADDPDAERVGELCDKIRDADEQTAWDELRAEFEEIDTNR